MPTIIIKTDDNSEEDLMDPEMTDVMDKMSKKDAKKPDKSLSTKDPVSDEDMDNMLEMILQTLDIMKNKPLMQTLKVYAKKKAKDITSIQDLRDVSNELAKAE